MKISSGFKTLDELLGGDGFLEGSIIMIRGEAGTGKTTFAFQIAQNIIKDNNYSLSFVCVEDEPEVQLNYVTQSFWHTDYDKSLGQNDNWITIGPKEIKDIFRLVNDRLDEIRERIDASTQSKQLGFNEKTPLQIDSIELNALIRSLDKSELNLHLNKLWKTFLFKGERNSQVIVIDSLNALINQAQHYFGDIDKRQMLAIILRSFQSWWSELKKRPTVIFTAEEANLLDNYAAESYSSDVVISLKREVVYHKTSVTLRVSTDWKEELLFCRVIKGRGLKTQRRSACYEFDESSGIKFFPTYAAQGLMSLFFENKPQWDMIKKLREVDMPSSYPGVIVQEFTRPALQRMFAVRRYAERIPPRHPMLLSHIDEYWVSVLRKANLLYPIPSNKLTPFSMDSTGASWELPELAKGKKNLYDTGKKNLYKDNNHYYAVPQMGNIGIFVYRKDLLRAIDILEPPKTWNDVENICKELREIGQPYKFLIETQTYDTLLATVLELGWSNGAFWRTMLNNNTLSISFKEGSNFKMFVDAIKRLHNWVHNDKIIDFNSSVDPSLNQQSNWVFARHWHSTWVDVLTRESRDSRHEKMISFPENASFGIARIPISKSYHDFQTNLTKREPRHHSCSGEWFLAIQKSSENIELGIDLINNLMTARKVTERAISGSEIPLVSMFYKNYGRANCYGTDKTFDEVRKMFAADARSRLEFDDYRTVGRILYGAIMAVITNKDAKVRNELLRAFKLIDPKFRP